jgi:hypothetical protein
VLRPYCYLRNVDVESAAWRSELMVRRASGSVVEDRDEVVIVRTPAIPGFQWGHFLLVKDLRDDQEASRWCRNFEEEMPRAAQLLIGVDVPAGDHSQLHISDHRISFNTALTARNLKPIRPIDGDYEIRRFSTRDDWACLEESWGMSDEALGKLPADREQFLRGRMAEIRLLVSRGKAEWFGAFAEG